MLVIQLSHVGCCHTGRVDPYHVITDFLVSGDRQVDSLGNQQAKTGWVHEFILYPWGDPRNTAGTGAEFVAVDRDGNIYGGEPRPRNLQKYVRVRP